MNRRALLGGAAAGVAAGALPGQASAAPRRARTPRPRRAAVIVVGAGLAGLAAAREVARAGRSVLVLEARTRVGGRTLNHGIGSGEVVEIGGQWVGPTQDRLLALARELDVATYKTYNLGNHLYYRSGSLTPYSAAGPLGAIPPDAGAVEAFAAISSLNEMAAQVPREAPWRAARAREWDAQTFETWKLANTATPGARHLLDLVIQAVWACEPADVSLLHVLFYIRAAGNEQNPGNLDRLINTGGGAQEERFAGGSQLISLRMAEQLGARRVRLGTPVRRIEQRRGEVRVVSDRLTAIGKQVIVTAPPAVAARIDYFPALTPDRDQLTQRFPMGSVIKCHAIYEQPFWRAQGLTGQVTSDTGPVKITFDNSPPDGAPGVLLGFIEAREAREWLRRGAAERRAAVLESFARYFGPRARSPRDYVEMSWASEEWTRGCYVGYTPPGVLTDYGEAIRAPVGRIHWAGAETAMIWNGYMDGAVRSGERAARDALAALG